MDWSDEKGPQYGRAGLIPECILNRTLIRFKVATGYTTRRSFMPACAALCPPMRILIIEDEVVLAHAVQRGLQEEGYQVDCRFDGPSGLEAILTRQHDLILLDRRLPGRSGLSVLAAARSEGLATPVLMLTALGSVEDRVDGLDAGADDYLSKPFAFDELLARMRALLRRPRTAPDDAVLALGPVRMERLNRSVSISGTELVLRAKEYQVLEALLKRKGRLLSRTVLCERVWGQGYAVSDNTVDVTVSGLRSKLSLALDQRGLAPDTVQIETVRGGGYRITAVLKED